jgi:hypothetical protein
LENQKGDFNEFIQENKMAAGSDCSDAGIIGNFYRAEFITSRIFFMAGHCSPVYSNASFADNGMDDFHHPGPQQIYYVLNSI